MATFAEALKVQLEATPTLRRRAKRLLAVINGPESTKKAHILERLERHARVQMGYAEMDKPIDWGTIDWASLLETLLKLLLALLPLLI